MGAARSLRPQEIKRLRRRVALCVINVSGYGDIRGIQHIQFLREHDGRVADRLILRGHIVKSIRMFRPALVITDSPVYHIGSVQYAAIADDRIALKTEKLPRRPAPALQVGALPQVGRTTWKLDL
jgi:hypothetical protein